jgi:tetratricopeptide (TPR) repeat protein
MKKIVLVAILFCFKTFAQKEGYWDKERATSKEITLSAGKRTVIKTEDLPIGTTEFIYRITVLDENQKLSSSLVSVLKAIPDPSGISQGAAGAIHLTSTITGSDKCTYALFSSADAANLFLKEAKLDGACLTDKEKVNKVARLVSTSSTCLTNIPYLWFGIESKNWVMNQKIVLEVVPWVDYNASRGWDKTNKIVLVDLAKIFPVTSKLKNKEQFFGNFVEMVTTKYTYNEFSKLIKAEKTIAIEILTEFSLKKTGEVKAFYDLIRDRASAEFLKGNHNKAIEIMQVEIFNKKNETWIDYGVMGDLYLFSKQFTKAEEAYNKGLQLNATNINFNLNLAHVYMFTNRMSEAKEIHKKFYKENLSNGNSWKKQVEEDFKIFEKQKLDTSNFNKIRRVLD